MKYTTVPFVGGFYADENRPFSVQDCLNYLPAAAEVPNTRSPQRLITAPGLRPYIYFGGNPIRGMYNAEGRLFVLAGTSLYLVSGNGTATFVGTVPGVGRVSFSHNQISSGNQVLVNNGSAGYVYDTVAKTFTRITDTGYPGGTAAVFMDGYIIQIEPARRYAFNSAVADATSYSTLDRFTSEVSPDLLVGLAVVNNDLVLFSQTTTEFFDDTAATSQPFRTKRITMTRGCGGQFTIVNLDNTLYWLGNDGVFYLLNGYQPLRISTFPIEQAIADLDWSQAFAFTYESKGHKIVYWTFPDGHTWGYDVASRLWHRRESYGLNRWRVNALVNWNGQWVAGDFQNGVTWIVDWDYMLEGLTPFVSQRTTGVLSDNQNLVLVPRLEVVMETGQPQTVGISPTAGAVTVTGNLPDGTQGDVVSLQYQAAGGIAPFTFSVSSGALPAGLTLSSSGLLSGTYTGHGSYTWVVKATDSVGSFATVADSNTVASTDIVNFTTRADGSGQTPQDSWVSSGVIAVGLNNGQLTHSADNGVTWSVVTGLAGGFGVVNVCHFNSRWYVYGGGVWSSAASDFVFSNFSNGPSARQGSLTVANGKLLCGNNSTASSISEFVSAGASWTQHALGASDGIVVAILWTGTAYLATTENGSVYRSTNLTAWTKVTTTSSYIVQLARVGGTIIGGSLSGNWFRSTDDGLTWSAAQTTPTIQYVCSTPSQFIGGRTLGVYTSANGVTWASAYTATNGTQFVGRFGCDKTLLSAPVQSSYCVVGTT